MVSPTSGGTTRSRGRKQPLITRTLKSAVTILLATGALSVPLATPSATVAHASTPECGSHDLVASYRGTDAGVGHRYGVLKLRNVSGHACFVRGYGGLSYVGHGDGTQVGAAADRDRGNARRVVLTPRQRARSAVDEVVAENYGRRACRPTHVDGFRVYVPDSRASQFVKHPTTGCAKSGVHLISHRAYR